MLTKIIKTEPASHTRHELLIKKYNLSSFEDLEEALELLDKRKDLHLIQVTDEKIVLSKKIASKDVQNDHEPASARTLSDEEITDLLEDIERRKIKGPRGN